jgi:hypothetical protein
MILLKTRNNYNNSTMICKIYMKVKTPLFNNYKIILIQMIELIKVYNKKIFIFRIY